MRVGEGLHLLGGEDPHAVEGLAPVGGVGVGHVTQVHAGMVGTDVTRRQVCDAVVRAHRWAERPGEGHHQCVALTAESPRLARRRDLAPVLGMAAGVLVVHIVLSGRYGFHHDELYLLASGRHPALGYVDQPPAVPLVVRGLTLALGEHLWPLRVVAGVAHAGLVVVVALIAGALGGRSRALVLAGLAAAVTPGFVAAGSRLGPASLGLLCVALAVLGRRADPRRRRRALVAGSGCSVGRRPRDVADHGPAPGD